jgi:hypothetical protein
MECIVLGKANDTTAAKDVTISNTHCRQMRVEPRLTHAKTTG